MATQQTTQRLIWRDEYLIGVDELDWEHQDLFQRLNELHDALAKSGDLDAIEDCLGEIHARVESHFALEEQYMRANKFAGYDAHKEEHDEFLEVLVELAKGILDDPEPERRDNLEFQLQAWVINHVITSDRDLATTV